MQTNNKMKTKAYERQSLLDIALIVAGDADAAFDIALQNGLSITDKIGGSEILTYSAAPINRAVLQYYRNNNIEPATALD
jgi:hypothetical protein